jgi:regulator of cell morphogenesis and NO signaling
MNTTACDWTTAPVVEFIDHIVSAHHEYLKRQLPRITELLGEARAANGAVAAELAAVWRPFVEEMNEHLWKEEVILFPMVRVMSAGVSDAASHCGGVQNPIRVMLMEHDAADRALTEFRRITGEHQANGGGAAMEALYQALKELDADLREHMHKENDILFPRIVAGQAGQRG